MARKKSVKKKSKPKARGKHGGPRPNQTGRPPKPISVKNSSIAAGTIDAIGGEKYFIGLLTDPKVPYSVKANLGIRLLEMRDGKARQPVELSGVVGVDVAIEMLDRADKRAG